MRIPFLSRPEIPVLDRRRSTRLSGGGDCYVRVEGRDYQLRNWSEGGFLIAPYEGGLKAGQKAQMKVVVRDYHDPDGALHLDATTVVLRIGKSGLAARFIGLPRYKIEKLRAYHALKNARRR